MIFQLGTPQGPLTMPREALLRGGPHITTFCKKVLPTLGKLENPWRNTQNPDLQSAQTPLQPGSAFIKLQGSEEIPMGPQWDPSGNP